MLTGGDHPSPARAGYFGVETQVFDFDMIARFINANTAHQP
jgi:hypothetical protein